MSMSDPVLVVRVCLQGLSCMKILHWRKRNENINKMESEGEENRQKERK